jgi:hypothetical protein
MLALVGFSKNFPLAAVTIDFRVAALGVTPGVESTKTSLRTGNRREIDNDSSSLNPYLSSAS